MNILTISTKQKDEVIDLTDTIQDLISDKRFTIGVCAITVLHTTCAITTADLDPGTDLDLLDALRNILPPIQYRHPHDPQHAPDHILSSLIGPSVTIPISKGELILGVWQRIVLVELDGPKQRKIAVSFLPE